MLLSKLLVELFLEFTNPDHHWSKQKCVFKE